ncbi:hypothetical protein HMPREF1326_01121 [Akkermansia sp. KLE1605]|nr:hypothetical protein HMPREF1326_01121 [Akkermansia sp. KLE1605]
MPEGCSCVKPDIIPCPSYGPEKGIRLKSCFLKRADWLHLGYEGPGAPPPA